ncbi:MAG: polysaccharide biosynthesis/export family protein [Bacteroidales bacterium]|jgi:polysaccharide export outer membrane protein|nr:polysaccharide biosynthesis/export family protein [Bacteroidales bacterium]
MKMKAAFILILFTGFISSCVTTKKLTYLQHEAERNDTIISATLQAYKVQAYDNLFLRITTPDPQWSDMFNTTESSGTNGSLSEQSADLISYSVNAEGFIELPFAGRVPVSGKNLVSIKGELDSIMRSFVKDADVTVKMINNYVTILGEVRQPGKYQIYKERMNIFQALGLASDLADFSDRSRIQIIRQIPGGTAIKEFSLTDRSILASEYFYVMPNDVIYAKPMKGRFFKMDTFPFGLILSAATTLILFLSILE